MRFEARDPAEKAFQDDSNNQNSDDRPVAVNDANTLGAQAQLVAGNVMANDSAGNGGAVSALTSNNTGSSDSRADGSGNLQVNGEFGRLTVNSDGSYRYTRTTTQDNVTDLFTYKLTDRDGDEANATLAIRILDDMVSVAANAQRIVAGPDGVVTLPPGVGLDDIRVVGRDLVVTLPDGTQLVIVDGAVFVPQLVLDGVQVPPVNLAALLIGQEPVPAAGGPT